MTLGPLLALFLLLAVAPALPGLATRTRALLTGRRGAPVLQLYRDLAKLLRKNVVYSRTTTVVFRIGPVLAMATAVVAGTLLPLDGHAALLSFSGDLVAFTGLLGLGRFALVLA
ncbi:MAG: NADH-quinone oxidoreductase subunit H, partial [Gemmatimonadota bacterium]